MGSLCVHSSAFPIAYMIMNLPADVRGKWEMLQWFGMCEQGSGTKPPTAILYERFVHRLLHLWQVGFRVYDAHGDDLFTCRIMLYGIVLDYVGLVDAINHNGATANMACCKCSIKGVKGKATKMTPYLRHRNNPNGVHAFSEAFVRRAFQVAQECYDGHIRNGRNPTQAYKKTHEEVAKHTGWKLPPAFLLLPYFRLTTDVILDGMHIFMNFGRRTHTTLGGDDMSENMREQCRLWKEHRTWWPNVPNFINPFAIPNLRRGIGGT